MVKYKAEMILGNIWGMFQRMCKQISRRGQYRIQRESSNNIVAFQNQLSIEHMVTPQISMLKPEFPI